MTAAELEAFVAQAPKLLSPATAAIAGIIANDPNGDPDASVIVSGLVGAITIVAGQSDFTAHVLIAAIGGLQRALTVVLTGCPHAAPASPAGEPS